MGHLIIPLSQEEDTIEGEYRILDGEEKDATPDSFQRLLDSIDSSSKAILAIECFRQEFKRMIDSYLEAWKVAE